MQLITMCALSPQNVRSWRLTFSIIIVSNALQLLRAAVFWKRFKFLGVFISHDLTWTVHCDYIRKKASRRLYALRQLRRCRVAAHDSVMVYCSLVRSILEYACVMFAALPQYLSDSLERIQKRALPIIFPGSTYSEALNLAGIPTLQDRRSAACHEFIMQLNPDNPVYKRGATRLESTSASAHYSLRSRDSKN